MYETKYVVRKQLLRPLVEVGLRSRQDWAKIAVPELLEELELKAEEIGMNIDELKQYLMDKPMNTTFCLADNALGWILEHPELIPEYLTLFSHEAGLPA